MSKQPLKELIIVSHSHWDREWYLPFEAFRWRLVETIDQLLDLMEKNPKYTHFTLDGQTIVLEDYLEIRPENRSRLENLIKQNRLHIGPWYVLADEFLVSGESLIRNLLIGHQIGRKFGDIMSVGYTPDTFGHIAQLPQLLRGFNIESSFFWRGFDDKGKSLPTEFRWRAPDGSEVLSVHLGTGYGPVARLPKTVDAALAQLLMPVTILGSRATSPAILLLNGSDHLPPQPHLPQIIDELNSRFQTSDILAGKAISQIFRQLISKTFQISPDELDTILNNLDTILIQMFSPTLKKLQGVKIRHGTLMDYLDVIRRDVKVQNLPILYGEQHSCKHISVLPGVFSSRLYLKQVNAESQLLLERWAEPFATVAWLLGAPYPMNWLHRAWKLLLQNHPHDSICGCSVDATHEDMERRFAWSKQLGNLVLNQAISYINERINTQPLPSISQPIYSAIRVFNPHTWNQTDVIRVIIKLDHPAGSSDVYALFDAMGNLVPCQVTLGTQIDSALITLIEQQSIPNGPSKPPVAPIPTHSILLTFIAHEIPGLGFQTYYLAKPSSIHKSTKGHPLIVDTKTKVPSVESSTFKITVTPADGTLTVLYKPNGHSYNNLLNFEDTGDIGDEYNYCPPVKDKRITSQKSTKPRIRIVENGPIAVTIEIATKLPVPEKVDASRQHRSSKTVQLPIQTLVSLYADIPRIDVFSTITNTAKDHRLRVLFPSDMDVETAWADTPFYVNERSIHPQTHVWADPLFPTIMDLYLTQIFKFQKMPGKPIGWLEDPTSTHAQQTFVDVTNKKEGLLIASRGLPEYEVLNDARRSIALTLIRAVGYLSRGDLTTRRGDAGPTPETPGAQCLGTHKYHYSIIPHLGTWRDNKVIRQAQAFTLPLRVLQTNPHNSGSLEPNLGFVKIEPTNLLLSAFKKAEEEEAAVMRFYEVTGNSSKAKVETSFPIKHAFSATLAEEKTAKPVPSLTKKTRLTISVPSHRIQTLLLYPT
jgi:mannosylglycerate hydrolase